MSEHSRKFFCVTCNGDADIPMSPADTKTHLAEKHGVTELKGERKMEMCLDGDDYLNIFNWTIGGVAMREVQSGPKRRHQ